jgi:predicted RNA-binding Zn-ribbon protein involved in translation (DUF1610 family)
MPKRNLNPSSFGHYSSRVLVVRSGDGGLMFKLHASAACDLVNTGQAKIDCPLIGKRIWRIRMCRTVGDSQRKPAPMTNRFGDWGTVNKNMQPSAVYRESFRSRGSGTNTFEFRKITRNDQTRIAHERTELLA